VNKGTRLGHYEIVAALGKGAMGEVYLAQDTRLDRHVALKILSADLAADSDRLHRFIREAKSASALNHPNIITVYDIGEAAGTPFIAYEFIDGTTLGERVRKRD
jgi:serine/threonine protein kinase